MRWSGSLRFSFEVPLLFASQRSNSANLIKKSQYCAGLSTALDLATSPVSLPKLGKIIEDSFDLLNPA